MLAAARSVKQDADRRYHRYLRDAGLIIPDLAKASGLVVIANGAVREQMDREGLAQQNEQVLEA